MLSGEFLSRCVVTGAASTSAFGVGCAMSNLLCCKESAVCCQRPIPLVLRTLWYKPCLFCALQAAEYVWCMVCPAVLKGGLESVVMDERTDTPIFENSSVNGPPCVAQQAGGGWSRTVNLSNKSSAVASVEPCRKQFGSGRTA